MILCSAYGTAADPGSTAMTGAGGGCCNSDWSHSGAFIKFMSMDYVTDSTRLTKIDADADMGDTRIKVTGGLGATAVLQVVVKGHQGWARCGGGVLWHAPGSTHMGTHTTVVIYRGPRPHQKLCSVTI